MSAPITGIMINGSPKFFMGTVDSGLIVQLKMSAIDHLPEVAREYTTAMHQMSKGVIVHSYPGTAEPIRVSYRALNLGPALEYISIQHHAANATIFEVFPFLLPQ